MRLTQMTQGTSESKDLSPSKIVDENLSPHALLDTISSPTKNYKEFKRSMRSHDSTLAGHRQGSSIDLKVAGSRKSSQMSIAFRNHLPQIDDLKLNASFYIGKNGNKQVKAFDFMGYAKRKDINYGFA